MKRVFISGYYGFANTGDEAILTVILSELRKRIPNVKISVISGRPEETAAAHKVDTVLWSDPLAISDAVQRADLVIVGGGGLFHDYTGFPADALLTEGNWGIGFHTTAAFLAALHRRPLMLYAVGIGPLFSDHAKLYTRAACAAAQTITVRDADSKAQLVSLGVPDHKVQVTADPGFLLDAEPAALAVNRKPLVAVVVRYWNFGVQPVFWETEVAAGLDQFLEDHGGEILFVPFQQFPGEAENDLEVARRVHSRMRHKDRATIYQSAEMTPHALAGVLGASDLVVGMRLHALIFAAVMHRPVVALRYDPKVQHAVERLHREQFSLDIHTIDARTLAARMGEALQTPAPEVSALRRLAALNADFAIHTMSAVPPECPAPEILELWRIATQAQLRAGDEYRRQIAYRLGQVESLSRDFQRMDSNHKSLISAYEQLQAASNNLAADVEQLRPSLETARREREEAVRNAQEANERTLRAEAIQMETADRLRRYLLDFNSQWNLYRSQRAWKAMLVVRRAYSLLVREGMRGKFLFLPWLFSVLAGRPVGIEREELSLPDLRPYLPDETRKRL